MKRLLCVLILLTMTFCAIGFTACSGSDKTPDAIASNYENLAKDGTFVSDAGSGTGEAVFDFGKEVSFNTLVLKEKGNNITSFEIYIDDGDVPVYGNDYIEGYRYCAFGLVTAAKIRIKVTSCDGAWEISEVEAYNINRKADDFDVMAYINVDTAYLLTESQAKLAQTVTQFNLFGCTYFNDKGDIIFKDYEIDGKSYTGKEVLSTAVENLREANPAATLVITVLGNKDFGDGLSTIERYNAAMDDNADALTASLLKLIEDYGLDGVSFDYEYPEKIKDFNTFSKYIKKLDGALPQGKLLTAAISDWCMRIGGFSAKDLEPLDAIELMAYDLFDERGNHAAFYRTAFQTLQKMEKNKVDLKKVRLGLAFYSRPINKDSFWGGYDGVAEKLAPYENTMVESYVNQDGVECPATATYYNGRQMIYDKTSFAVDSGAGGVMIWHFGCDSQDEELSLLRQIDAAIKGEYII